MVYFVQSAQGGAIKIGRTIRLAARLKNLRTVFRTPDLRVLAIVDESRFAERELHRRFADHWLGEEWFEPVSELLEFMEAEGREWKPEDDAPDPNAGRTPVMLKRNVYLNCRSIAVLSGKQTKDVINAILETAARRIRRKLIKQWLAEKDGVDENGQMVMSFPDSTMD